jgi:hypothetical protein
MRYLVLILLCSAFAAAASAQSVVINEFRRDGTWTTTEYMEIVINQSLTAAQLEALFFGDSTSATAAKFAVYRLTGMSGLAATFPAGTIITIGGTPYSRGDE